MRPALPASLLVVMLVTPPLRAEGPPAPASPGSAAPPAPSGDHVGPPPPVTAGLDFSLGEGAERCPGRLYLHQEVSRRIGYDPFAPNAKGRYVGRFRVAIARAQQGLTATIDFEDASGAHRWSQTYPVYGRDKSACEVAISGVAIKLRPELRMPDEEEESPAPPAAPQDSPAPPPPPTAVPASAPAAPVTVPAPLPPAKSTGLRVELGLGGLAGFGTAPSTAFGGFLHAGVQIFPFERSSPWWLSVAGELRLDVPVDADVGQGFHLRTNMFAGSVMGCVHWDLPAHAAVKPSFFGCMVGMAGNVSAAHVVSPKGEALEETTYAGAGPRLGVGLRLTSLIELRIHGTGLFRVSAASAAHKDAPRVWATPRLAGDVGLALLFLFGGSGR